MNDAARILRYFVPGALFLLLYGLWFVLDSELCDCYERPEVGTGVGLLIGGAAVPIGFVMAQIAAAVAWSPLSRFLLRRIDNKAVGRRIGATGSAEELVGIVDARLHLAADKAENAPALARARSLTDLYQALGNGAAASGFAALAILGTVIVTSVKLDDASLGAWRAALAVLWLGVSALVTWRFVRSHQRVVRIAQAFIIEVFERRA